MDRPSQNCTHSAASLSCSGAAPRDCIASLDRTSSSLEEKERSTACLPISATVAPASAVLYRSISSEGMGWEGEGPLSA